MAVLTLVLGCAAAAALAVATIRWFINYMEFRRCELAMPGPRTLPILGSLLEVTDLTEENVFERAIEFWAGRRELARFTILNKMMVFVSDPDDLAALIRSKEFTDKSSFFYEFIDFIGPKGLVRLNGAEWKRHRLATQPAFHAEVLDSYGEIFAEEAENFVKRIESGKEQDLHDNLYQALGRTFVRTAMTADVNTQSERVLVHVVNFMQTFLRTLNERSLKPWLAVDWIFNLTENSKVIKRGVAEVHSFLRGLMLGRRAKLAAAGPKEEDFIKKRKTLLDVLLDASRDEKFELTDQAILDEIVIFIGAAVETSASTLSSVMKLLSFYQDVQKRLHEEVMQVLGDKKRSVTLDDLPKMEYLDKVIKETLRLLPAIPFVARQVHKTTEFAGKTLPAGTTLILNIFGAHRDPRYWAEPLRFNPHRFAAEDGGIKHPFAYLPFSAGARNCIGNRYAMQNIKAVVATTIRDYHIGLANDGLTDHHQLRITFDLAMRFVGGTRVTFTPRT